MSTAAQNARQGPARRGGANHARRIGAAYALAVLAIALSACAPAAGWLRDQLDTGGGATLTYVEGGVRFDPGSAPAFDVHVTLRASVRGIVLNGAPASCVVDETERYVDCSLGRVSVPVDVLVSGVGIIGSATYTRAAGSLAWEWAYTPVGGGA